MLNFIEQKKIRKDATRKSAILEAEKSVKLHRYTDIVLYSVLVHIFRFFFNVLLCMLDISTYATIYYIEKFLLSVKVI